MVYIVNPLFQHGLFGDNDESLAFSIPHTSDRLQKLMSGHKVAALLIMTLAKEVTPLVLKGH